VPLIYIASAVIVLWFGIEGLRHGVVRRVVEIVGLIAIFLFASTLAGALRPHLARAIDLSPRAAFFTAWVLVLIAGIVVTRLLARGVAKLFSFSIIGWLDRGGGFLLGTLFGCVLVSCLMILLLAIPLSNDLKAELREDPPSSFLLHLAPAVYDTASEIWHGDSFGQLVEEVLEPNAREALDHLRAFLLEITADKDEPAP
jgi:uncharacterized membrane protein required for colicin V production